MEEERFDRLRKEMVDFQLKNRGIKDRRVLNAFLKVPRHEFVPYEYRDSAYTDQPLPIGEGQTISQPYMVALMTELLKLRGEEKVLEIGTGSGYQTAILLELASFVYSVEKVASLAQRAEDTLNKLGYINFEIKVGDGTRGWEEYAPYQAIIVTAGAPSIPQPLTEQMDSGGRIVIPVGDYYSQDLILGTKEGRNLRKESICGCVFVPLIGDYGWKK